MASVQLQLMLQSSQSKVDVPMAQWYPLITMHKSRGMTLISILIAMGLFGVLLLGIMSAMTLMNKSERGFRQGSDATMQNEHIHNLLKDKDTCTYTLKTKNPHGSGEDVTEIKNKDN